jgi:hypothetical protein
MSVNYWCLFYVLKARLQEKATKKRGREYLLFLCYVRLRVRKVLKANCIFHAFLFLLDFSFHAHVIVLSFNARFLFVSTVVLFVVFLIEAKEMLHIKTPLRERE